MSFSCGEHLEAVRKEMTVLANQLQMSKQEVEKVKMAFALGELEKIRREETQSQQAQAAMLMGGMPNMMMARFEGKIVLTDEGAMMSLRLYLLRRSGLHFHVYSNDVVLNVTANSWRCTIHCYAIRSRHEWNGARCSPMRSTQRVGFWAFHALTPQMNVSIPSRNPSNGALSAAQASATSSPRPADPLTPQTSVAAQIGASANLKEDRQPPPSPQKTQASEENVSVAS
ncbi:hypothetical protein OSTOST_02356 [Ostertagia ostertagi]